MCLVFRTAPRLSEMEGFGSSGSKAGLERSLQELSEGVLQSIVQVSSKMESTWDHRTWTVITSVFPQLVPSRRMHLVGSFLRSQAEICSRSSRCPAYSRLADSIAPL